MNQVLFSKKSDNWATPKVIYDFYINQGYFDPCPLNSDFDGLKIDWKEKKFCKSTLVTKEQFESMEYKVKE